MKPSLRLVVGSPKEQSAEPPKPKLRQVRQMPLGELQMGSEPVIFYLSDHDRSNFETPLIAELRSRVQEIYAEEGTPIFGDISEKRRFQYLKGTGTQRIQRTVIEVPPACEFNWNQEYKDAYSAFVVLFLSLDEAVLAVQKFWEKASPYSIQKERSAAVAITNNPSSQLALFGSGHPDLVKLVGLYRPVEVHYPAAGYPIGFDVELSQEFRKTGAVKREIYLRAMMEFHSGRIVLARKTKLTHIDLLRLSNYYASAFSSENIVRYRDQMVQSLASFVDQFKEMLKNPKKDQYCRDYLMLTQSCKDEGWIKKPIPPWQKLYSPLPKGFDRLCKECNVLSIDKAYTLLRENPDKMPSELV